MLFHIAFNFQKYAKSHQIQDIVSDLDLNSFHFNLIGGILQQQHIFIVF